MGRCGESSWRVNASVQVGAGTALSSRGFCAARGDLTHCQPALGHKRGHNVPLSSKEWMKSKQAMHEEQSDSSSSKSTDPSKFPPPADMVLHLIPSWKIMNIFPLFPSFLFAGSACPAPALSGFSTGFTKTVQTSTCLHPDHSGRKMKRQY